ncbi:MAG: DMT family transporter [bacterium]
METEQRTGTVHYLLLTTAVIGISFSAILIRLTTAPPVIVAVYRLLFSLIFILPILISKKEWRSNHLRAQHIFWAILSGLCLALHFFTWITSLQLTSVVSSVVLVTMQPIFTLLAGHFFLGEKVTTKELIGVGIALSGALILTGSDAIIISGKTLSGNGLAFLSSIFYAGYLLLGRWLRRHINLWIYVSLVYGVATSLLVVTGLMLKIPLYPYPCSDYLLLFLLAAVSTLGGHTVFNWLLGYLPVGIISVSILGEPVGATILAFLILQEIPIYGQILGGILVLIGIGWFLMGKRGNG